MLAVFNPHLSSRPPQNATCTGLGERRAVLGDGLDTLPV